MNKGIAKCYEKNTPRFFSRRNKMGQIIQE